MGKWTRRAFLTTGALAGGGLIFGVAIRPGNRTAAAAKLVESKGETQINTWVKLLPDNSITIIVPHVEMGQGAHTSVAMMLAEELDADWSQVNIEEAPAHSEFVTDGMVRDYLMPGRVNSVLEGSVRGTFLALSKVLDLQLTGGSYSIRGTGVQSMQVAGAAVRALLISAAAKDWSVSEAEIRTENSHLLHDKSGFKEPYITYAKDVAESTPSNTPTLKDPSSYSIMGNKDIARRDIPSKVDGSAQFGVDVSLPGMKVATVKAAPVFGARVERVDSSEALAQKGVHKVVDLGDAVAVIADGYWLAKKALKLVDVTFSATDDDAIDSPMIYQQFRQALDVAQANGDMTDDISQGNAARVLSDSDKKIEAEYSVPYLAHAAMEPMNCTALVEGETVKIWTGTQIPLGVRAGIAKEFDFDEENVLVTNLLLGGGFGRRAELDYVKQAVALATEMPGTPVKLIWSREEDIQHDHYRQAMVSRFKGALDSEDRPIAWWNLYHDKHEPLEAPDIPYAIENKAISYIDSPTHIPFGPWRSVDHSVHAFFTESFIDEMATEAGQDPFEFRRDLLAHKPRLKNVLETVAAMSAWTSPLPEGWGRGIALHQSFGSIVAQVAHVSIKSNTLRVEQVFCAADPGLAVSPNGYRAQMESGIVYGLTAALFGNVEIENGAVKQSNFHDYLMLRMNQMPEVMVEIINSGEKIGGGGEPGTPPIAPAVANAVFALTGKRQRNLPIAL